MKTRTVVLLALLSLAALPLVAVEIGPEIPVDPARNAVQQNVAITRDTSRTLVAFEEVSGDDQLSRVVMHRYEARIGTPYGRLSFALPPSSAHQRRPAFGNHLVAWVEEPVSGGPGSVWIQALAASGATDGYEPVDKPERVDRSGVAPGTKIAVTNLHVFHLMLWTGADLKLYGAYRSLIARIGYDPSPFAITQEEAVNPATAPWNTTYTLIAYNVPEHVVCITTPCPPRNAVRATVLGYPANAIDIAPADASAPKVVYSYADNAFHVFWSMASGGTFVQKVIVTNGVAAKSGEPRRIHDGRLEDAALAQSGFAVVVWNGARYELLRFDHALALTESIPFVASVAAGSSISIGSDDHTTPVLAYASTYPYGEDPSEAVLRFIEQGTAKRRRSIR